MLDAPPWSWGGCRLPPEGHAFPVGLAKDPFVFCLRSFLTGWAQHGLHRKPSDPLQNHCEQLSRRGDLRQLEGHVLRVPFSFPLMGYLTMSRRQSLAIPSHIGQTHPLTKHQNDAGKRVLIRKVWEYV
jgi:hypothetical protein